MSITPTEAQFLAGAFAPPKQWQKCPVCLGRGLMPHDFYNQFGVGTSTAPVECKSCHGKGIV